MSLIILLSVSRSGIVLSTYLINKGYIQDELCVEKDIPFSTCNGSCWLAAQLKNSTDGNLAIPFGLAEISLPVIHYVLPTSHGFTLGDYRKVHPIFAHTATLITSDLSTRVFRPPIV